MFLLHDCLPQNAGRSPERVALVEGAASLSHADLNGQSEALGGALQRWGVQRGDRVVLVLGNSINAALAIWAVLRCGGVVVPMSPDSKPPRIRRIVEDCAASAVVSEGSSAAAVRAAIDGLARAPKVVWTQSPAESPADPSIAEAIGGTTQRLQDPGLIDQDLAAIIYTSGTTGEPKGTMLTHRNLTNTTASIASYLRQEPDDVVSCVLPLAFSYGLFQVLTAGRVGSAVVLERSFAFPYDVLRRIQERRVTMLPGVPSVFAKLLQMLPLGGLNLGSLRCMTNAAAALPPAHVLRLRESFPSVALYAMYGQTECTRATFLDPSLVDRFPGSVGGAIPNCEVYLVDENRRRLPNGSEGELVVRGANVMRGYWGREQETAAKLQDGPIAGEKVLMTGDRFRSDSRGLLYFVSRSDDIFKCRGEKVAPCAIEQVLCELVEVAEAAVVGVEDPDDGMAIKAVIVPRAGERVSESQVRQHCRKNLEPALVPRFIEIRDFLPTTESGKLRRRDLRSHSNH